MENNTSHLRWNTVECVYSRICIYHVCNETKALPEAKEQQPLRIANGLLHIQGLLIYSGLFYQFSGFNSPKGTIFSTYALLAIQCLELHNTLAIRRLRRLLARPTGGSLASLGVTPPPLALLAHHPPPGKKLRLLSRKRLKNFFADLRAHRLA